MSEVIINKTRYECPPAVAAYIKELETENARFKELYQKSVGVIAATDCVECKDKAVKHGHWLPHKITASSICSVCRRVFADETPYCPNCGAKMDGESE